LTARLATLVLLALLAHGLGLANGFVYDDHRFVDQNPALADVTVTGAFLDASTQTADLDRDVYRPLRLLGHAWDARRWGLDPFGFHLHSLLMHVANVLLAFFVLRHLTAPHGTIPALLGAGLLAVHPLGVEAVGWISSRGDLYALGFGLVALGLGTGWRTGRAALVLAAVTACLATLGKESAAVLPLVAWLHLRLARRWPRPSGHEAERPVQASAAGPWSMAAGVALGLVLRQIALSGASPIQTQPHGGHVVSQGAWAVYGLSRTLGAVLLPTSLSVEYPQDAWGLEPIPVWIRPATLLGFIAVATPFVLARLGRARAAFLSGWLLLAYLPSSSLLITLRDLVNDRAAYPLLPAAGALLGLACGRRRRLAWILLIGLGVPLALASSGRNTVFRTDETLWRDVLAGNQQSVRAHLGLAVAAQDEPTQRLHFARALENSRPGSKLEAVALSSFGDHLLRQTGDPAHAVPVLERALDAARTWEQRERATADTGALAATLAEALEEAGRSEHAEHVLTDAIDRATDPTMLLVKRAQIRLVRAERSGLPADEAALLWSIEAAERAAPEHPLVRRLRQLAQLRLGHPLRDE
jgi:hypothetical protein